jgi:hypothetical protein
LKRSPDHRHLDALAEGSDYLLRLNEALQEVGHSTLKICSLTSRIASKFILVHASINNSISVAKSSNPNATPASSNLKILVMDLPHPSASSSIMSSNREKNLSADYLSYPNMNVTYINTTIGTTWFKLCRRLVLPVLTRRHLNPNSLVSISLMKLKLSKRSSPVALALLMTEVTVFSCLKRSGST